MKKYLFVGCTNGNTGPANVNKGIVANLSDAFCIADSENKVKKYTDAFLGVVRCKVVVVSGMSKVGVYAIKLAKLLNKKTVYIMHGCYEIETALNESAIDENSLQMERYILHTVDLLLPVSKRYSQIIQEKYPFCKEKTAYLHNGVEKINLECGKVQREKGRITAVGGDRKLKNNVTIARAMSRVNDDSILSVYGHLYHPYDLPKGNNIEYVGLVPQEQLYKEMMRSELFVLNSTIESFGLTVFDALQCGCSVLVSNAAGALDLLDVKENDVIFDPMNENEIASKIDYLLANPNNARLVSSLDFDRISYQAEVEKLENYCNRLCN